MQTGWYDERELDFNEYFAFCESSPQEITLHVPKGCMQAYASAPGWNLFSVIIDDLDPNARVNDVQEDNSDYSTVNVYNLQGILIKDNATQEEIESLPAGIYIVNGRKVIVK